MVCDQVTVKKYYNEFLHRTKKELINYVDLRRQQNKVEYQFKIDNTKGAGRVRREYYYKNANKNINQPF